MRKSIIPVLIMSMALNGLFGEPVPIKMKDAIVNMPGGIVEIQGKFYVLDRKLKKIFVFNREEFLFSFSQAGQGPGDIDDPVSLSTDGQKIFTLERWTGVVSMFSPNGDLLGTFKLKDSQKRLYLLGDFKVYDNKIAAVLNRGIEYLRVYDLQGNLLKRVSKDKEDLVQLSHLFEITLEENHKTAYIFSRFSGEIRVLSLETFQIIDSYAVRLEKVDKTVAFLKAGDMKTKSDPSVVNVEEFENFFSLLKDGSKLTAISRIKENKEPGFPCFTFISGTPQPKTQIDFALKDGLSYIQQVGQNILLIDEEGSIFIKH